MKKLILNICILCAASVLMLASCKKDDQTITYSGGTNPVVAGTTPDGSDTIVLTKTNSDNTALTLNWTNPGYKLSTGVSTLNVTYYIEVDTLADFSTEVQISSVFPNLSTTFAQKDLNSALLAAGYPAVDGNGVPNTYKLYFRIVSSIGGTAGETNLNSNSLTYIVTTYLDVAVALPLSDLWMVGTLNGWNNSTSLDAAYKFTKTSNTTYSLTVTIPATAQFCLIGSIGDWSDNSKYGSTCGSDACNDPASFGFKHGGNNMGGPLSAGTYTVNVDFVKGTIKVTQ